MATYIIGDIHGCYLELEKLLKLINYNQQQDHLFFTGDIINGGPKSIETLIFIKSLGNKATSILGNHDLALLSMYKNPSLKLSKAPNINIETTKNQNKKQKQKIEKRNNFQQILNHPQIEELLEWLINRPLLYFFKQYNILLIHAGLYPFWSLDDVVKHASFAENILRGESSSDFFQHMYGDLPNKWNNSLTGWERVRFIINAITRMRFCDNEGRLELKTKGPTSLTPKGFKPWFEIPNSKINKNLKIIFGHWSALVGITNCKNAICLDTGCIWGGALSALRLEDNKLFQTPCPTYCKIDKQN